MSKQRKATERAEKEPSVGEKKESDGSVPARTVRELMQDQQRLMKEQQESQRQILMEIINVTYVCMSRAGVGSLLTCPPSVPSAGMPLRQRGRGRTC